MRRRRLCVMLDLPLSSGLCSFLDVSGLAVVVL